MKRKKASVLLSCIMTTVLFTGCTITVSPTTPGSASESTVQSDIEGQANHSSSESASSEPTASPDAQSQEASGSSLAENKEYTDLSFLTEEQQQLYETACEISFGLYGMGGNLMYSWGYRPVSDSEGRAMHFCQQSRSANQRVFSKKVPEAVLPLALFETFQGSGSRSSIKSMD